MRNTVTTYVLLLLSMLIFSACGQTGPLFLPGDPSQIQTTPTVEQPAQETDDDEDDEQDPTIKR